MRISRTPYRISLFGGGTDYSQWFNEHGGAVIGTTIDKYCYITLNKLDYFDYKYRIVWSEIEQTQHVEQIHHNSVRECIKYMEIDEPLEIHHIGELPARTGIGSSSAFTVGMLEALGCEDVADTAIHLEQNILKENVGCQDQIFAAHGGFCRIVFTENSIAVQELDYGDLENYLMLFFTGFQRTASEIVHHQLIDMPNKVAEMKEIQKITDKALIALDNKHYTRLGALLHDSWEIKKTLSPLITTPEIDEIYDTALKYGALGGKICGAGGGGFMLLFVEPDNQDRVQEALNGYLHVPFSFSHKGTKII